MRIFHWLIGSLLVGVFPALALAQPPGLGGEALNPDTAPVAWTARFEPATGGPGDTVKLVITVELPKGLHTYPMKKQESATTTEVTFKAEPAFLKPAAEWVDAPSHQDAADFWVVEGKAEYSRLFTIQPGEAAGERKIELSVKYLPCTEFACASGDKTRDMTAALTLTAAGTGAKPQPTPVSTNTPNQAPPAKPAKAPVDMGNFLLLAIIGALASLLTPCVFPMIPITLSYFVQQAEDGAKKALAAIKPAAEGAPEPKVPYSALFWRQFSLGLVYALGIVITFTVLALGLGLIFGPTIGEAIASNPWLYAVLSVLVLAFALSFFGMFEITMPAGLVSYLQNLGGEKAGIMFATFMMGVVFTLTSFACTGPIAGSILAYGFYQGDWTLAVTGVLVYSVAFALPFLILAMFPMSLPRSGPWMVRVKVILAFILLFASSICIAKTDHLAGTDWLNREMVLCFWGAVSLTFALYLLNFLHFKLEAPAEKNGPLSTVAAVMLLGAALYFLGGAFSGFSVGEDLESLLPEHSVRASMMGGSSGSGPSNAAVSRRVDAAPGVPRPAEHDGWFVNDYDAALAAARASEAKPLLFVDFTGNSCPICRANERSVFPDAAVREQFMRYVLVELWTDVGTTHGITTTREVADKVNNGPRKKLQAETSRPCYVLVDPVTEEIIATIGGKSTPKDFEAFLRSGYDKRRK